MKVLFVAGVAPIVDDAEASSALYIDALGLPMEKGDYPSTNAVGGLKHFGLWPLSQAARSCFGSDHWPDDVAVPQATIEFEVEDVEAAARELESQGYELVHGTKTEPWKQVIARLLSPEGLLVGVCHTPWLHSSSD